MKKNNFDIESLVKRVIEESLEEKVDELTNSVKSKMDEYVGYQPTDIAEEDITDDMSDEKILQRYCDEDSDEYDNERCKYNKKALMKNKETEMSEELHGGQKKLDKNKNGKLDKEDFQMLRKGNKTNTQEGFFDDEENNWEEDIFTKRGRNKKEDDRYNAFEKIKRGQEPEDIEWEDIEDELDEEVEEGNEFSGELAKARKSGKSEFEVGGKTYPVKESKKNIKEKWEDDVEVKKTGEYEDLSVEEINAAIKRLKSQNEKYKKEDKKVPEKNKTKMSQLYFAKRAKQGWKGKGKAAVKESIQLTEDEMIDLIEKIVKEEKNYAKQKPKGLSQTEKVLSANKKENDDYIKSVTKKLKDYLKDGSKETYTPDAKHFPKGNGELAKMEKKAYSPDDVTQEYIDNFTAAGLENLVYDEINPDEKWVSDNIEGSSRTGNNPEWANAVETELGKKKNKQRKENLLGAVKQMAYNKAPQPVTDDDSVGRKGKFEKNFGKDSGKKAIKILNHLESVDDKKEKLVKEEFNRINNLMNYSQKTQ